MSFTVNPVSRPVLKKRLPDLFATLRASWKAARGKRAFSSIVKKERQPENSYCFIKGDEKEKNLVFKVPDKYREERRITLYMHR